jgi:uncharacterized protein VcgC/VcgE DUF2780
VRATVTAFCGRRAFFACLLRRARLRAVVCGILPDPSQSTKDNAMADFLADLASRAGVGSDQAHQGVGALLSMMKDRLDPETFEQLKQSIPGSDRMLSTIEEKFSGSGLLSNVVKAVAARFAGGGAAGGEDRFGAIEDQLAKLGLTPDHLKSLLPKLHELVGDKLPPEVVEQIQQHFPEFDRAAQ